MIKPYHTIANWNLKEDAKLWKTYQLIILLRVSLSQNVPCQLQTRHAFRNYVGKIKKRLYQVLLECGIETNNYANPHL